MQDWMKQARKIINWLLLPFFIVLMFLIYTVFLFCLLLVGPFILVYDHIDSFKFNNRCGLYWIWEVWW